MKFTHANLFMPITGGPRAGKWLSGQAFRFFESDDKTGPSIDVALRDQSNGADVPPPWAVYLISIVLLWPFAGLKTALYLAAFVAGAMAALFPRIHAEYIAATFIHDIGLKKFRSTFSRWSIDKMFLKAMRLERWPLTAFPGFSNLKALARWLVIDLRRWIWRLVRPYLMFAGVTAWGLMKERQNYFKIVSVKGNQHV